MPEPKIDAWWFAASDRLPHNDGRKIVIGKKHSLCGEIILCEHALHCSREPFDALPHAPGPLLYKVRVWGDVVEDYDKLGARNREYIAMRDITSMLRAFAREQALSVIHLWDAPDIVRRYLETGDETIRAAAWDAAWAGTRAAARADARAAACDAAWAGIRDAAWAAAWDAAWAAAWAASWDAAWAAAWDASWAAARAASWAAARADAWAAARADARAAARKRFNEMVNDLFAEAGNA